MTQLVIPVGPQDHHQGPLDAPVTLVEYGDYECPYCGEAYPLMKAVQAEMGQDLCFVFRNFPLTELHRHALRAAEFAEAAASVGLFWQAHDLLYENQNALADPDLRRYARQIGLPPESEADLFSGAFRQRIQRDFDGGIRSGVNGTPCLFINGRRYDGSRDFRSLVSALTLARSDATRSPV